MIRQIDHFLLLLLGCAESEPGRKPSTALLDGGRLSVMRDLGWRKARCTMRETGLWRCIGANGARRLVHGSIWGGDAGAALWHTTMGALVRMSIAGSTISGLRGRHRFRKPGLV